MHSLWPVQYQRMMQKWKTRMHVYQHVKGKNAKCGSTLVRLMAWCLTAHSHDLNQYLNNKGVPHYNDVTMGVMASQISSLAIVYSTVYSGSDQRKHQSSTSLALVRGIHRWPVNSPHKWPVTRKMFPFDDVIMVAFTAREQISNESVRGLYPKHGIGNHTQF